MADDTPLRTKLSTKGQVVLPKDIRRRQRWEPGAELIVEETPDGVLLRRAPLFARTRPEDVAGSLGRSDKALTIEEMDAAVLAEARRQDARSRY
jgi:AbrB family looped-hinge helix DNA binding protein